ncbi:MAG TPA: hypothetical protein VN442_25470 [Bryobacteraceae bacterium]|nr:hypothetical protein [Bryobacteraceae bacterium]
MKRLLLVFVTLALAVASAKTYRVTLFEHSVLAGTQLKPGDYKLEVKDSKVVITNGRQSAEAPVTVENANEKFASTSVRYNNGDGQYKIKEIRLGGTTMKLVVN